ncbi:MAG: phosphoribosylformylglycinamidine synthase [Bacteroidales bacterium]|nr:phosphoribosylformylglycinamidine synthase [Bacteroidales bacterium]
MILFFEAEGSPLIAVKASKPIDKENIKKLEWLFGGAAPAMENGGPAKDITGCFVGPRKEMITPWSTTAVEITQNMNISGIERIEEFFSAEMKDGREPAYDKMLQRFYRNLNQDIFTVDKKPDEIEYITDFEKYNEKEGLALNPDEIKYLKGLSDKLGRPLTDSEVFGFSQVNSEHCRHKIFNGTFIIDGKEMESSLFKMIKKTSKQNPNLIVSAYKDNCAFLEGPEIKMFHPEKSDVPSFFETDKEQTVISLKAETHNFPTTVEPFNGAATGSGGEIRDRMGGGKGSFPIAGTAVYMTSYPRLSEKVEANPGINEERTIDALGADFSDESCKKALKVKRSWEEGAPESRKWLYQTPQEILTKASNGASDFGNKFGQCVICGSLLTEEQGPESNGTPEFGYDKVIMLAGGIGFAKKKDAIKDVPDKGDKVVLLGGDNYRIGMGGGAVSSVNTGEYGNSIELNAVQRANPEMQKRVYNVIRAISEEKENKIISVHDHGAGGHLNCLSELVEETGGKIDIDKLPVGDPTLSLKEIIGNESQERMGFAASPQDTDHFRAIAERERAPYYEIGEATGDHNFTFRDEKTGETAIDLKMSDMFGSAPKTYMRDVTSEYSFDNLKYDKNPVMFEKYLEQVLQLESVACKDWLTNKVDRSVTGLVAGQQCTGKIQLPLNDLGVTAIGYDDKEGIATSLGHAPAAALIDSAAGSRMAIAEALTNVVWTPLKGKLHGVSLSANWMWPSRNRGEDARLYKAVKAASDFACALGINIPTGKDSMSMTQSYPDGKKVLAPGTLIISTVAPVKDVNEIIRPDIKDVDGSSVFYIPFTGSNGKHRFDLGGSAFAQTLNGTGTRPADVDDPEYFAKCFDTLQDAISGELVLAGHDISAGGLITTALEMFFPSDNGGMELNAEILRECSENGENDIETLLFAENPGVLVQIAPENRENFIKTMKAASVRTYETGRYINEREIRISSDKAGKIILNIDFLRDLWFKTSYLLDIRQSGERHAAERFQNYKKQPLEFKFPSDFTGRLEDLKDETREKAPVAAIIREKGSNGDREMAWSLALAGFKVKDGHMTDLISGRENLQEVKMIVFVGGFSNADTLGSAKGWAGAFLYNKTAAGALDDFYARKDTLSLGICNGCQLMAELGLITPENKRLSPKMLHNDSHKFESAFLGVEIEKSPAVMLKGMEGSKLGIWVAHGEGKFSFGEEKGFATAVRFSYNAYPANPNGSPEGIAGVCSPDGRHLAMMPHPERCIRPWNWAYYPQPEKDGSIAGSRPGCKNEVSPWLKMFVNARKWCEEHEA